MQHSEASTAEILGIIKRVIERENREVAAGEKRKREPASFPTPSASPAPAKDGEGAIGANAEEVLDLGGAELVVESDYANENAEPVAEPDQAATADPLTSNAARQSVNDSFAALAMLAQGDASKAGSSSESPLEGMVREMLRPMLAEWLDTNLPAIVGQLVREEIDRIAGKTR